MIERKVITCTADYLRVRLDEYNNTDWRLVGLTYGGLSSVVAILERGVADEPVR